MFVKFEYLIKTITSAEISGGLLKKLDNYDLFNDLLDELSTARITNLLYRNNVIDKSLYKQLEQIGKVRNQLAHSWDNYSAIYKDKYSLDVDSDFNIFIFDLKET